MEKDYIKISEYASRMSMQIRTAYRYFHNGKIQGFQDPDTQTIFVKNPFKEDTLDKANNSVVLYARVSSSENKSNLDSQMERLRLYALAKGYTIVNEVKEVGSGLNDKRDKLNRILTSDFSKFDCIIVEHKDRLTRFGFNYLETLLESHKVRIEVINHSTEDKKDLIDDFVAIITSFCARIYGQRRNKRRTEKLIEELKNE